MKSGYKTSEFWLSLLVMILGALLSSGAIADGGLAATIIGGALALLGGLGYTFNRMGVKKADSYSAAYVARGPANDNANTNANDDNGENINPTATASTSG